MKQKNTTINNNFVYLFKEYYTHGKKVFYLELVVAFIVPIQTIIGVYLQKNVIDIVLNKDNLFTDLMPVVLIYFSASLFLGLITIFINVYLLPNMNLKTNSLLTSNVYSQAKNTDLSYYDNAEFYNNYTWTLSEYVKKSRESKDIVIGIIKSLLSIFSLLLVIVTTSPLVIVIVMVVVILNTFLNYIQKKVQLNNDMENLEVRREQNYISRIFYMKEYAEDLKVFPLGKMMNDKFHKNINKQIIVNNKYRSKNIVINAIRIIISCASTALMFIYLGFSLSSSAITAGTFTAVYSSSLSLKNNLIAILDWGVRIKTTSGYAERIKQFFEMKNPNEAVKEDEYLLTPDDCNYISFNNLSFAYDNTKYAINGINFDIGYGEKIVIVGDNGSGKSTLLKLLLRLYSPTAGEIRIDGKNLQGINIKSYRENIRYYSPSAMLYAYSLFDNLFISENMESVQNIDLRHIFNMSNGEITLNTSMTREFDPDGKVLSSGESQLIKLERAFIKSAKLSIFDEPCMNLDYNNEQLIMDRIMNLEGIVIIATHSIYAVNKADKIVFMKNGIITEIGSHHELIKNKKDYYNFYLSKINTGDAR